MDEGRQFFKSIVGLSEPWASARETPLTHSFCQHVVATGHPLIVTNAPEHPLVADNLAIPDLGVVAYAGMPLRAPGGAVLGSFCAIDTAPRQWTPAELEVLEVLAEAATREVELRTALRELDRLNQYKTQMVGFTSHELRTPLNGIMGALQVIDLEMPAGADRKMLGVALESSRRLLRIINDLLDVEQLETGALPVHPAPTALDGLITATAEALRPAAADRGLTIGTRQTGLVVWADPDRTTQVLTNLLGNALKFSPAGSTVDIVAGVDDRLARIAVVDRGRGVPDALKERIFERFAQVEASDKHQRGGAGLGLAICRAIVTRHDGTIWVEDTPGGGSTFAFTLPLAG